MNDDEERELRDLEQKLSFQKYYVLLNRDDKRLRQVEKICKKISYHPMKHHYLDDVLFHIQSINYHHQAFKKKYLITKRETSNIINEELKKGIEPSKNYLFNGLMYNSMDIPNEFVSFITTIKRGIESSLKFFIYSAYKIDFKRSFSLHKFYNALNIENRKLENINEKLKMDYPDFREEYIVNWNSWINRLNEIRVEFEHIHSASGFLMRIKATYGFKNDRFIANLKFPTKEDTTALIYVNDVKEKTINYINNILIYLEQKVENDIDSQDEVNTYFRLLNSSPWFNPPQLIGHQYELELVNEKTQTELLEGREPFDILKMYDEEE